MANPGPIPYEVVNVYPHDPDAFTQGLIWQEGKLYESTGLRGKSSLREVDLASGKPKRQHDLHGELFAEGLTLFRGKLYQLTWEAGIGLIYDPETFQPIGQWRYEGEGWGLTHNNESLIMSDGSAVLTFLDPKTLAPTRQVEVKLLDKPLVDLNELEFVDGFVYANVWFTDLIVKIDPKNGQVVGWIDFSKLHPDRPADEHGVLNGIAYQPETGHFFVTGKLWNKLYEIRLNSAD